MSDKSHQMFERRKRRVRLKLRTNAGGRPRLSVFRSSRHIYAQVIDDATGRTLASASTKEEGLGKSLKTGADVGAAKAVGAAVAERARKAGVDAVVFDRNGFRYHGRIKAVADGAREGGLKF